MNNQNCIISGLWIGNRLSPIEILCIKSYIQNGHEFHLYTYEPVQNVPRGTVIKDAGQIIPHAEMQEIISKIHKHAYAIFSDIFRYRLLYKLGGWWSDLDAICIKHFDIDQEYVFINEKIKGHKDRVCNGIIKSPPLTPIMDACYQKAMERVADINYIEWYALGPLLLDNVVREFGLEMYTMPSSNFTSIGNYEVDKWLRPYDIGEEVYSIHIYNDVWNTRGISKYGIYARSSLIESLKRKYSVRNNLSELINEFMRDLSKTSGIDRVKSKTWFIIKSYKHTKYT